jgi:cytochrome P450
MSSLFLQSEVNPYSFYQKMIEENAVYWDETDKIWAIYSYAFCSTVLNNSNAEIPTFPVNNNLNQYALRISHNLARLSNGVHHEITKETAVLLFSFMKSAGINEIMKELLRRKSNLTKLNYVDAICKKLPLLTVLKSFDFNDSDSFFITENIGQLIKIMQPHKTDEDVEIVNKISKAIYLMTAKHIASLSFYTGLTEKISTSYKISSEETISICVSNLIGLFIQSYDAGRGLLSNALLQVLSKENAIQHQNDKIQIQKTVIETLRFDPPIHNTRRIAAAEIHLNGKTIKKNDPILIVLAAANRDQNQFENPMIFDIERSNNHEHLTFGTGGHMCVAKHFSIHLTTEALRYLFDNYNNISILEDKIEYEPLINARLPKAIWISII